MDAISEDVVQMARARTKHSGFFDFRPLVKHLGWQEIIRQTGVKSLVDEVGMDKFVSQLTREQRQELLQRLQETRSK